MVRLILEENGKHRAFRVGDGVLKLGSGPEVALRLESEGIAAEHAELEIVGDHALVRVAPGGTPPEIDGEVVLGEVELRQGQGLRLGQALVWLEDEATAPGSGRPASGGAPPPPAKGSSAAASATRREASRQRAMQSARSRQSRSKVQRSRPRVERGLPTAAVIGIVLGVVVIAGFLMRKAFQVSAESSTDATALLRGAKEKIDEALYDAAESKLQIINHDQLTPDQKKLVQLYREQIAAGLEKQDRSDYYREGNKWFDVYLAKYESKWLQGNPPKSRIRLFLKRAREFRERWPEHEELDWLSRQEQRFRGAVNLSDPPTFSDIDWEIEFILLGTPRKYEIALDLIDEYLARTDTPELDREAAQALRREIEEERPEQFSEAMKWAKHEHEVEGDDQKAVQWLVYSAAYMADPALEDQAAQYLLQMPDLKAHLEAYQREKPEIFEALVENDIVRRKAAELGIL